MRLEVLYKCYSLAFVFSVITTASAEQQCINNVAADEWRKRIRFCVSAKDGRFAHNL